MTPAPEPLRGVGKTALGVALIRARESRREDRLFDDPYAQAFVDAAPGGYGGEAGSARLAEVRRGFSAYGVIRTRFYDDYLRAAATRGCRQVVLLAAGLDTRAFRLAWPAGTRLFELDLPDVLAFKEAVLAARGAVPGCERVTVAADLRSGWQARLAGAGFEPASPTAWLAEGLMIYLTSGEASRLLTVVGDLSAPRSRLAFGHGPSAGRTLVARARKVAGMGGYPSLWRGGLGDGARDWLTGQGWRTRFHDLVTVAMYYGRPVPAMATGGFLTAVRPPYRAPPEPEGPPGGKRKAGMDINSQDPALPR